MQIRIEFTGLLRAAAGVGDHCVDVAEGTSLKGILICLVEELGPAVDSVLLTSDRELAPGVVVCVNGAQVLHPAAAHIQPGDVMLLISAISGG